MRLWGQGGNEKASRCSTQDREGRNHQLAISATLCYSSTSEEEKRRKALGIRGRDAPTTSDSQGMLGSLIARTISFRLTYCNGPWNQRKNTNLISLVGSHTSVTVQVLIFRFQVSLVQRFLIFVYLC